MNQNFYNSNSFGFDQSLPPQFPVIHQPPQKISVQEMEDLKQQYLDEMKHLINLEYRDEIKIHELKGNFNSMSIKINKKEKLQQLEQVANLSTYPSKRLNSFCYDDDDDDEDYTVVITPDFSITDSLIMENEHLDTIPKMESNEFIKSSVENLVPIPSESEDFSDIESERDMPDCDDSQMKNFSMFSNPLFDDSTSSDDESSHEESYLLESLLNRDTLMASSPKFDSLFEEFFGELAHTDLILSGINEAFYDDQVKEISSGSTTTYSDFLFMIRSSLIFRSTHFLLPIGVIFMVKDNKEKDKIRTKPDKIKSKREAWKSPDSSPTKSKPREYSQWVERFMNYPEEQTDREATINSIKNGDQPLPRVTQVSIARTLSTEQPPLKDKSMCNKTVKNLGDALARHMLGSEYGEQDRKVAVLYDYEIFKATEGELLLDTYIRYLQNGNRSKKKTVVVTSDPLALIAEKTKVSKSKEKVIVSSDSEGSEADDFSELKKITALLAKAFNRRKFYSEPTNNNLSTSSTSQSANMKQEFVKNDNKKVEKKDDEKKRDMSRFKCYKCKKQVLLAEDQAWMESSSDSDQEINANMIFMAQIEKVLSDSEATSSFADEKISEVSYYLSESKSEFEFETS
nr:hypothetical protein [Tanacetum cinerariifolium]